MIRNPLADMLIMAAQNQANHPSDGTNQPDYAAILRAAFPQQYPTTLAGQAGPSIEIKPEDEESVPSPSDTVDRAESPASTTESLPKEAENGSLKRPAAIQELLLSKRARLSKTATPTPANSVTDGSSTSAPSPIPEFTATGSESESIPECSSVEVQIRPGSSATDAAIKAILDANAPTMNPEPVPEISTVSLKSEPIANGDDTETTSGSPASTDASTPPPGPSQADAMTMFYTLQRHMFNQKVLNQQGPGNSLEKQLIAAPYNSTFTQVPSRLTLLAQVVKYNMTVGEVRRRITGPEAFNFSLLGALLRRAKLPTKSNQLVEELASVGLSITRGRRRAAVTLFSGLTEDESVNLSRDFGMITEQNFPAKQLADKAARDYFTEKLNTVGIQHGVAVAADRRQKLEGTRELMAEFMRLLSMDRSPICDQNPEPVLPANIQDPLNQYSMLTHGFGSPGILVGMQAFANFVNHQIESLSIYNNTNANN